MSIYRKQVLHDLYAFGTHLHNMVLDCEMAGNLQG